MGRFRFTNQEGMLEEGCRFFNICYIFYLLTLKKLKKITKTQVRIVAPRWNLPRIRENK
jgi:hypothetical protein